MTLHTEIERSDEDSGKYRTDEAITFENLLGTTARESEAQPQSAEQSHASSRERMNTESPEAGSQTAPTADTETASPTAAEREAIADMVGAYHADHGPDETYLVTRTTDRGAETTYSFHKAQIDGTTFYYLLQKTMQPGTPLTETWAILDVGTSWEYNVPDVDREILHEGIRTAREHDWRAGREEAVAYLTNDQLSVIQNEYQSLVETKLTGLTDTSAAQKQRSTAVVGEYVVAEVTDVVVDARLHSALTDRQRTVVAETLPTAVGANLETQSWGNQGGPLDREGCPVIAELTCDFS